MWVEVRMRGGIGMWIGMRMMVGIGIWMGVFMQKTRVFSEYFQLLSPGTYLRRSDLYV